MSLPRFQARTLAFFLATGLATSAAAQQDFSIPQGAPSLEQFRAQAALELGAPASSIEIDRIEGPVRLPELGIELYVTGVLSADGEKSVIALTGDGQRVDVTRMVALENELAASRHGKLSGQLATELGRLPRGERVPVIAWIAHPDLTDLRLGYAEMTEALSEQGVLTHEIAEQHQRELAQEIAARIAPLTKSAADAFQLQGFVVAGSDEQAPVVFLELDLEEAQALAGDERVLSLDWAGTQYADRLNVAHKEVRANLAWALPGGVTGAGAKVSIVEGGTVCNLNPFMPLLARRLVAGGTSHTTGVGSCIKSSHPTHKGVAPGASLISANGADFWTGSTNVTTQMPSSVAAISWSVAQGAQIMNLSYGAGAPTATVSSFDKYLDWVARNNAKTIVIACGNSGAYAGDPGAGYNQIAVGNFGDNANSIWAGEAMAASSSWQNPSTGVETPQVAAPGQTITMLSCSPFGTAGYTASGTSFSSPLTAGTAALLVSKQPALGSWPEAVRAIVMATAWHNIEGAARLSSRDGAGGIDARAGVMVASRGKGTGYNYGSVTPASFDASGLYTTQTVWLWAGQNVRASLSFDSTVSGGPTYNPDVLKADLDLYVYGPTGLVATSLSAVNPFEVVQFTVPVSGVYRVRIKKYSFTGLSEYWGTALTMSTDA